MLCCFLVEISRILQNCIIPTVFDAPGAIGNRTYSGDRKIVDRSNGCTVDLNPMGLVWGGGTTTCLLCFGEVKNEAEPFAIMTMT